GSPSRARPPTPPRSFLLGPLRPERPVLGGLAADGGRRAEAHDRREHQERIGEEQALDVGIAEERLLQAPVGRALSVLVEQLEDPADRLRDALQLTRRRALLRQVDEMDPRAALAKEALGLARLRAFLSPEDLNHCPWFLDE